MEYLQGFVDVIKDLNNARDKYEAISNVIHNGAEYILRIVNPEIERMPRSVQQEFVEAKKANL